MQMIEINLDKNSPSNISQSNISLNSDTMSALLGPDDPVLESVELSDTVKSVTTSTPGRSVLEHGSQLTPWSPSGTGGRGTERCCYREETFGSVNDVLQTVKKKRIAK